MVGAVLVHDGRIIGEGWHQAYGQAHAEVNAVASVAAADRSLIPHSTLYVSLAPCSIWGKTPPCTDLIQGEGIRTVVISADDATPGVLAESTCLLRERGVEVITGVLENEGLWLARRRNTFIAQHRPYIILKFAQSSDGYIGETEKQVWLTGPEMQVLNHRWRAEEAAILVGPNTVICDDPSLSTRHYPGRNPLRVVLDRQGRVPQSAKVFNTDAKTLYFSCLDRNDLPVSANLECIQLEATDFIQQVMQQLFDAKVQSIIVEGGAGILNAFIALGLWDECRRITAPKQLGQGIKAPQIPGARLRDSMMVGQDLYERVVPSVAAASPHKP
jgi:diaminohydroxyphosphoribosylaminopyrimidine deaminase/5-amino-6-(5-phosphoribosylamino)uracil reductase